MKQEKYTLNNGFQSSIFREMINAPLSTATFPHRLLTILEKALGAPAI